MRDSATLEHQEAVKADRVLLSLPEIWMGLHAGQKAWEQAAPADRATIDESDRSILALLCEVEAARWSALCAAAGWTPVGASALSWCAGASLSEVRTVWETVQPILPTCDAACRPAHLLRSEVLPARQRLSDIVLAGDHSNLQICLMIANEPISIEIDLPSETLRTAAPELAAHILRAVELGAVSKVGRAEVVAICEAIVRSAQSAN